MEQFIPLEIIVNEDNATTHTGQPVRITCYAQGGTIPYSEFRWLKNDTNDPITISVSDDTMTGEIIPEAIGTYSAYVTVDDAEYRTANKQIVIHSIVPPMSASALPQNLTIEIGDRATLTILVTGDPNKIYNCQWLTTDNGYSLEKINQYEVKIIPLRAGDYIITATISDSESVAIVNVNLTITNKYPIINILISFLEHLRIWLDYLTSSMITSLNDSKKTQ